MEDYIAEIKTECVKRVKIRTNLKPGQIMVNLHKQVMLHPGLGLVEPDEKKTDIDLRSIRDNETAPYLDDVPTISLTDYMPPVKLGDIVYFADTAFGHSIPSELEITAIHISKDDMKSHVVARPSLMPSLSRNFPFHKFNKTWFVDKEKSIELYKGETK